MIADIDTVGKNSTSRSIRHKLVDLLSRREHSRAELVQKLIRRGYQKSDIIPVLNLLAEKDWQSDQRFSEAYVRYRSQKGFGPERIAQELKDKGIDSELIARFVYNSADENVDWYATAKHVYAKKFGVKASRQPLEFLELVRRKNYLFYKGFNSKHIDAAIKQVDIIKEKM